MKNLGFNNLLMLPQRIHQPLEKNKKTNGMNEYLKSYKDNIYLQEQVIILSHARGNFPSHLPS